MSTWMVSGCSWLLGRFTGRYGLLVGFASVEGVVCDDPSVASAIPGYVLGAGAAYAVVAVSVVLDQIVERVHVKDTHAQSPLRSGDRPLTGSHGVT